jgi:hypothetical protein
VVPADSNTNMPDRESYDVVGMYIPQCHEVFEECLFLGVYFCITVLHMLTPWPVVRKRTIPTERPPLVSEVSANFSG